jgi:hypothetical protein
MESRRPPWILGDDAQKGRVAQHAPGRQAARDQPGPEEQRTQQHDGADQSVAQAVKDETSGLPMYGVYLWRKCKHT